MCDSIDTNSVVNRHTLESVLYCMLLLWQRDVHTRVHARGPCAYTRCAVTLGMLIRLGHVCRATALCSVCRTWAEAQVARAACLQHVTVKEVLRSRTEWLVAERHVDCCNDSGAAGRCRVGDASRELSSQWHVPGVAGSVSQSGQQSLTELATGCSLCCRPA